MHISSYNRTGGYGDWDLCVLRRASKDADWGPPENLGSTVNSSKEDSVSSISADGLSLYFNSNRPGGYGSFDIYMTTRKTKNDPWGKPVILPPPVNATGNVSDTAPWISSDGLELYFASFRAGGYGFADIYVTRRATPNDPWGLPVNLGPGVNSPTSDYFPCLSSDGLVLFFSDYMAGVRPPRPGGHGCGDMWMTRRTTLSAPWGPAVNLGPQVNGPEDNIVPRISLDGSTLYYATGIQYGVWNYFKVPIIPIVDFNGDKKVDLVDLVMLINDWGKSNSVCDIGPMPWGDGKVDIEDLKVFMTYYEKENPPARP